MENIDKELEKQINELTGCRLTANKAAHICKRDGYRVTGVVMTLSDGRACIVNLSAVRWLHDPQDLWNLLHTETPFNHRLIKEAELKAVRNTLAEAAGVAFAASDTCCDCQVFYAIAGIDAEKLLSGGYENGGSKTV